MSGQEKTELIRFLELIATLKVNQTYSTANNCIVARGSWSIQSFTSAAWRKYYGENRIETIDYISARIYKAIDLIDDPEISSILKLTCQGLQNLRTTYNDDQEMVRRIFTLISTIYGTLHHKSLPLEEEKESNEESNVIKKSDSGNDFSSDLQTLIKEDAEKSINEPVTQDLKVIEEIKAPSNVEENSNDNRSLLSDPIDVDKEVDKNMEMFLDHLSSIKVDSDCLDKRMDTIDEVKKNCSVASSFDHRPHPMQMVETSDRTETYSSELSEQMVKISDRSCTDESFERRIDFDVKNDSTETSNDRVDSPDTFLREIFVRPLPKRNFLLTATDELENIFEPRKTLGGKKKRNAKNRETLYLTQANGLVKTTEQSTIITFPSLQASESKEQRNMDRKVAAKETKRKRDSERLEKESILDKTMTNQDELPLIDRFSTQLRQWISAVDKSQGITDVNRSE